MSWNLVLFSAINSSQKVEMSSSGIPRISSDVAEFWKNLLATFPVLLFPCGFRKKDHSWFELGLILFVKYILAIACSRTNTFGLGGSKIGVGCTGLPHSCALSMEVDRSFEDGLHHSDSFCLQNYVLIFWHHRILRCIGDKENCLRSWNMTGSKDKDSSCTPYGVNVK